jgi:hypothetical protein
MNSAGSDHAAPVPQKSHAVLSNWGTVRNHPIQIGNHIKVEFLMKF